MTAPATRPSARRPATVSVRRAPAADRRSLPAACLPPSADSSRREQASPAIGSAGIGLVEVLVSIVVASVGVLAAAAVALTISSQTRIARAYADRVLAARAAAQEVAGLPYDSVRSSAATLLIADRPHDVARDVTSLQPRLKRVRVTVSSAAGAEMVFETLLARGRPLPAAP